MSELANFVAANIRDKVVHDLQEDIRRLEIEGPSWTIEITGPGGSPVFSTGKVSVFEVLKVTTMDDHYANSHETIGIVMNEMAVARQLDSLRECQLILTNSIGRKIVKQIDDMNGHDIEVVDGLLHIQYGYSDQLWDENYWVQPRRGNNIIFSHVQLTMPIRPDHVLTTELQNRQVVTTASDSLRHRLADDHLSMLPELQSHYERAYHDLPQITTVELLSMVENTVNQDTPITFTKVHVHVRDLIQTLP